MEISNLAANPRNPRIASEKRLEMLKKALQEFGDLSGIVFNKKTGHLVGGHQRTKIFDPKTSITIEKKYRKPTPTGTVAIGWFEIDGERHSYREVVWDEMKESAAMIAANKGAGDWDNPMLGSVLRSLQDFEFDVSLSMFEDIEVKALTKPPKEKRPKDENTEGKKEKKRVVCPECNHKFVPGWQ